MSTWISVTDRLPKINHSVLFVYWIGSDAIRRIGHLSDNGVWYTAERGAVRDKVTHWAYLPSKRGLTRRALDLPSAASSQNESKETASQ